MSTIHRKARLNHLIDSDFEGVQAQFAKFASTGDKAYSRARISQLAGATEPFGESAAAALAIACRLPAAWFDRDWPTPKEAKRLGTKVDAPYPAAQTEASTASTNAAVPSDIARALNEVAESVRSLDRVTAAQVRTLLNMWIEESLAASPDVGTIAQRIAELVASAVDSGVAPDTRPSSGSTWETRWKTGDEKHGASDSVQDHQRKARGH